VSLLPATNNIVAGNCPGDELMNAGSLVATSAELGGNVADVGRLD
jgi:hypothetical protein